MKVHVRQEEPADAGAIREVHDRAFGTGCSGTARYGPEFASV